MKESGPLECPSLPLRPSPLSRLHARWPDFVRKHHEARSARNSDSTRELFPLPAIGRFFCFLPGDSRSARRRRLARQRAFGDVNEAISALSALRGADAPAIDRPTDAQLSCQSRLLSVFRQARQVLDVASPNDADGGARKLLGSRFDYGGQGSSVKPYKAELVGFPSLGGRVVLLEGVLDPRLKSC